MKKKNMEFSCLYDRVLHNNTSTRTRKYDVLFELKSNIVTLLRD